MARSGPHDPIPSMHQQHASDCLESDELLLWQDWKREETILNEVDSNVARAVAGLTQLLDERLGSSRNWAEQVIFLSFVRSEVLKALTLLGAALRPVKYRDGEPPLSDPDEGEPWEPILDEEIDEYDGYQRSDRGFSIFDDEPEAGFWDSSEYEASEEEEESPDDSDDEWLDTEDDQLESLEDWEMRESMMEADPWEGSPH